MFFDCTALVAGLIASIVTKWRANQAFTYGYIDSFDSSFFKF